MTAAPGKDRATDFFVFAAVAAIILGLFWFASGAREAQLRQSPAGFDGLAIWLKSKGATAETLTGRRYIQAQEYGLRVLPLYDGDLTENRVQPQTNEELLFQRDEVDLWRDVVRFKRQSLPTIVVLPKWRTGMRLTRLGHPALIEPPATRTERLDQIWGGLGELNTTGEVFSDFTYAAADGRRMTARLYAAQALSGSACRPVIGSIDAMILGFCGEETQLSRNPRSKDKEVEAEERPFWILSDPDLLNNHGLRLGDNAAIAVALLTELADGKRVVIDYTTGHRIARDDQLERREREWSDLARFFDYPFSVLWFGFAAVAALIVWRAGVRYGAPIRIFADGPGAAKSLQIEAKARLLRLSGHDGALLSAHVAQRLQIAAGEIFGPTRPIGADPLPDLERWLASRSPKLSEALRLTAEAATSLDPADPQGEAIRRLDQFEIVMEKLLNDFGRTPRGG